MRKASGHVLPRPGPVPPITMGVRGQSARSRAEAALRLLLRVIAVIWLAEGIRQWFAVLTSPGLVFLPAAVPLHMAGLFFFCILDLVAAVGLWLVASWGVAVWLATILGHGLALALAATSLAEPLLLGIGDIVLVTAYATLAWIVARKHRRV